MFRSLLDAGIVERVSTETGTRVMVSDDLQRDFSLHHTLALYLLETIGLLDVESETHALDLLTLIESILENPQLILQRQLDRIKTDALAEMKAAGVEYEERIAKLDELDYPKPNADFVYDTFNAFAHKHPWVGAENIRPKSVARDMVERFMSFSDYVLEYGLERAEGMLLRYLSEVYKVLVQTVPERDRTEQVDDLITFFGAMVRQVDSSLLDEWEAMRDGKPPVPRETPAEALEPEGSRDVTRDRRAFTVLVRNELFRLIRALASRDFATAATHSAPGEDSLDSTAMETAMSEFFASHASLRTDPEARSPSLLTVDEGEWTWEFAQVLLDPEDENDWVISGSIDIEASREAARPVLIVRRIGA